MQLINGEAKCACGAVSVTVSGELQRFIVCHCDYCQRVTGAIGTFSAQFLEEDIKSIEGKTTTYEVPNWPGAQMYFCSTCGTNVHWTNPYFPGMHMIAAGCFADPDFPSPTVVTQTQYRHSWCNDFDDAPHYEKYSSDE